MGHVYDGFNAPKRRAAAIMRGGGRISEKKDIRQGNGASFGGFADTNKP
jgi:hypothetical protein